MADYITSAREVLADELELRSASVPADLLDLYTLLVLISGDGTTLQDVHEAWGVWTARLRPDHRSLIPFDDLADEVKALDAPYRDAIVIAALHLRDPKAPAPTDEQTGGAA